MLDIESASMESHWHKKGPLGEDLMISLLYAGVFESWVNMEEGCVSVLDFVSFISCNLSQ